MTSVDYAALRAEVSIRWVLERIHYQPTRIRGDQWRGDCPLPNHPPNASREPTFSVNVERNIYHCFACHSAGNQLDLWAELRQLTLNEAGRELRQQFGFALTNPKSRNAQTRTRGTTPPATPGN